MYEHLTEEQNRIRKAINLDQLCRQFDAQTEIAIYVMKDSEVGRITAWLSRVRIKMSLNQMRECELPPGLFRSKKGDRTIARDHEYHPEANRHA